ncbi:hypothetical protein CJU89_5698 [Yarrowia sp. B02]|nr:hypothetical protein CJU89_5698 [Yarrowia sp. B02]
MRWRKEPPSPDLPETDSNEPLSSEELATLDHGLGAHAYPTPYPSSSNNSSRDQLSSPSRISRRSSSTIYSVPNASGSLTVNSLLSARAPEPSVTKRKSQNSLAKSFRRVSSAVSLGKSNSDSSLPSPKESKPTNLDQVPETKSFRNDRNDSNGKIDKNPFTQSNGSYTQLGQTTLNGQTNTTSNTLTVPTSADDISPNTSTANIPTIVTPGSSLRPTLSNMSSQSVDSFQSVTQDFNEVVLLPTGHSPLPTSAAQFARSTDTSPVKGGHVTQSQVTQPIPQPQFESVRGEPQFESVRGEPQFEPVQPVQPAQTQFQAQQFVQQSEVMGAETFSEAQEDTQTFAEALAQSEPQSEIQGVPQRQVDNLVQLQSGIQNDAESQVKSVDHETKSLNHTQSLNHSQNVETLNHVETQSKSLNHETQPKSLNHVETKSLNHNQTSTVNHKSSQDHIYQPIQEDDDLSVDSPVDDDPQVQSAVDSVQKMSLGDVHKRQGPSLAQSYSQSQTHSQPPQPTQAQNIPLRPNREFTAPFAAGFASSPSPPAPSGRPSLAAAMRGGLSDSSALPMAPATTAVSSMSPKSQNSMTESVSALSSPASSMIFERNVQEFSVAAQGASSQSKVWHNHENTHYHGEDRVAPALDASTEAIINSKVNPEDIDVISLRRPSSIRARSPTEASLSSLWSPGSPTMLQDGPRTRNNSMSVHPLTASHTGGSLSPDKIDGRQVLSFCSFADVVHTENEETRDGDRLSRFETRSQSGLRSPSPLMRQHAMAESVVADLKLTIPPSRSATVDSMDSESPIVVSSFGETIRRRTTLSASAAALPAPADDASYECHKTCGEMILDSRKCANGDSWNHDCLCDPGTPFFDALDPCLKCGSALWNDYGKYLEPPLAFCDFPTKPY